MADFGQCDPDIYANGTAVLMLHAPASVCEVIVRCAARRSGQPMDWHYMAGRAIVRTTGDNIHARAAAVHYMPMAESFYRDSQRRSVRETGRPFYAMSWKAVV